MKVSGSEGSPTFNEDAFPRRAADEGYVRPGVSLAWVRAVLDQLVDSAAHRFPDMEPPQAADLVVDTFLTGLGKS